MTDLTIDREQVEVQQTPNLAIKGVGIMLMMLMLFGSISLLNWAIGNRLAKTDIAESSQITMEFRERQLGCLAKNIYYEAGSEPFEGKVAVAQVTINRTNTGQFPSDICRTIYQKNVIYDKVICQFSWVCDRDGGVKPGNTVNYKESMEVAKKVLLEDFRLPGLEEALYYHADYVNPGWNKKKLAKIGHHIFYK
jgi:spore germination cell wall hydrolase CwlJ-like protein